MDTRTKSFTGKGKAFFERGDPAGGGPARSGWDLSGGCDEEGPPGGILNALSPEEVWRWRIWHSRYLHPLRRAGCGLHGDLCLDFRQHPCSLSHYQRSEEHTSEIQTRLQLVCRLPLG